jgi:hypothetical protein
VVQHQLLEGSASTSTSGSGFGPRELPICTRPRALIKAKRTR